MSRSGHTRFHRRTILAFLMLGAADLAMAGVPETSARPVPRADDAAKFLLPHPDRLVADANLGGKISYAVADARTGKILETLNPVLGQPPASVAKAISAIYAVDRLGIEHRFKTRVLVSGPISNGIVSGDLILVGGGDPTLDTDDLAGLVAQIKTLGVTGVTGKFLVQRGGLPGVDQIDTSQPVHVGYNPAVSGLNLNFNRVYLEWRRNAGQYAITMDARTERLRPSVAVAQTRIAEEQSAVFAYSDANGRDNWTVARRALGREGGRWLPVRRPELYAGDVFRTLAREDGIALPFPQLALEPQEGDVIAEHHSAELREICRDMLKYSTNLTAEVVGLAATDVAGPVAGLGGSAAAMSDWLADTHGTRQARFVDHSGLGDQSRISAIEMVRALVGAGQGSGLAALLKPIALREDAMDVVPPGAVGIVAKTGTLNFVSALGGYVTTPQGRELAFAVFTSDLPRRQALSRAERERPRGAKSWNGRAKRLQHRLLVRWATLFDS